MERIFTLNNEYVEKIHKVIDYIDKNTDSQLSVKELADIAGFSQYYFHRIFSAYIGEPLSTFVKRIRLEKSAQMLIYTNASITDAALSCGYETPSAYTKAFKQFFGTSPSDYKIAKNYVLTMERNNQYHNKLKETIMKDFLEIRTIEDEKVYYVRKNGHYHTSACESYKELKAFIKKHDLDLPEKNPKVKMYGIAYDDPCITENEKCRFDGCITITKDVPLEGNVNIETISGGKYAVFLHKGSYKDIGALYHAICGEWIPNNNYKTREVPMFEVYLNSPEEAKEEDLLTEIYLPIE